MDLHKVKEIYQEEKEKLFKEFNTTRKTFGFYFRGTTSIWKK